MTQLLLVADMKLNFSRQLKHGKMHSRKIALMSFLFLLTQAICRRLLLS